MNKSNYIRLFANCIPVKGAKNVIVCDIQRSTYFEIDMVLHDILVAHSNKTIEEIIEFYGKEYEDEILNQLDQLQKEELVHLTTENHLFPKLDLTWETPSVITNMIIEYGDYFQEKETEIVNDLIKLGVQYLELRFYVDVSNETLQNILQSIQKTKIVGIYLVLQNFPYEDIDKFLIENQRVMSILLSNATDAEDERYKDYNKISVVKHKIVNNKNCGIICQNSFQVNLDLFTESQQFNSCLNKKLSIIENGDIKNCPSIPEALGNIKETTLTEIFDSKEEDVNKYWNITKDQIEVCKDCEFRYICTDCRAFRESDNIYSKPLKCNYNPYNGKWEDNLRGSK
nr:grasp-with-spasm system SPASM domain peptide maturase [Kordia sp.]